MRPPRLLLAKFSQLLVERLRILGLAGTALAPATVDTNRLQPLKLAAPVTVSVAPGAYPFRQRLRPPS